MIQILISDFSEYSLPEMAQLAIEGGASWLILSLPDNIDALRDDITATVTLCREEGVILTIEDRPDTAREYGIHGVFLTSPEADAPALREELGPEAIIGVMVSSSDNVEQLKAADIDYIAARPDFAFPAGCVLPVVAYVPDLEPDPEVVKQLLHKGFSGVCAGRSFFSSKNPAGLIKDIIDVIA